MFGSISSAGFDSAKFTHPKMMFDEALIAAGGGVPTTLPVANFRASKDILVDLIGISDDNGAAGAANDSMLQYLDVNWSIVERAKWRTQDLPRALDLHNVRGDRSLNPVAANLAGWGKFRWVHAVPWIQNPLAGLMVDYFNRGALGQALTFGVASRGTKSGLNRTLQMNGAVAPAIFGITTTRGEISTPATMRNPSDEAYRVYEFFFGFRTVVFAGADSRNFNRCHFTVRPDIGDPWSEMRVPMIFYSPHGGLPNRTVWHRPVGGPVMLRAGQAFQFDVRNNHGALATTVQIAVLGRTAPGTESIE